MTTQRPILGLKSCPVHHWTLDPNGRCSRCEAREDNTDLSAGWM